MAEKTLFNSENVLRREEIAEHLDKISEKLGSGDQLKLGSGQDNITLEIPESAEFEIKVEEEADEKSLELEIEWKKNGEQAELTLE